MVSTEQRVTPELKRKAHAWFLTIQRIWNRHELDRVVVEASLIADLERVPEQVGDTAIKAIAASGGREASFVPTSSAILRKAAELDVAPPPWDQVRAQLGVQLAEVERVNAAAGMEQWDCPDGRPCVRGWVVNADREAERCSCFDRFVAHRRGTDRLDPMLRTWLDEGHAPWEKVTAMLEGSTTAEAQLRDAWRAYASRAIESRVLGLLSGGGGLKRLEQARTEEGARQVAARRRAPALNAAPDAEGILAVVGAGERERSHA